MPKFKVRSGKFKNTDGDGKTYTKGGVFESPHDNLDQVFVNKFIRVPATTQISIGGDISKAHKPRTYTLNGEEHPYPENLSLDEMEDFEAGLEERRRETEKKGKEEETDNPVEVTSDFPTAAPNDFVVFKKGKQYVIADKLKPNEALNTTSITSKKAVAEFIASQTAEDPAK